MSESGKRIEAPSPPLEERAYVRDNEIYWQAMTCTNPACPHAQSGGEPFLFVTPDPSMQLEDEQIVERNFSTGEELHAYFEENKILWPPVCPECRREFQLDEADEATLATYQSYVVPYELPETTAARQRIDKQLDQIRAGYQRRTGE